MDEEVVVIENHLKSAMGLFEELKCQAKSLGADNKNNEESTFDSLKSEYLTTLHKSIVSRKDQMMNDIKKTMQEFDEKFNLVAAETLQEIQKINQNKIHHNKNLFSQKVFKTRTSLLTKMYQNEDARTVYHVFIAIMITMFLEEMINTYISKGVIIDLSLLIYVFGDIYAVLLFWPIMAIWTYLIIILVQAIHIRKLPKGLWITLYIAQQCALYIAGCSFCITRKIPVASGFIVTCEMVRMSLKMHSYLREKLLFADKNNEYAEFIPNDLKSRGVNLETLNIPQIDISDIKTEIYRFTYFFFAPTLIYRDEYPKILSPLKFSMIVVGVMNVFGSISFTFALFQNWCVPYFEESWVEGYSFRFFLVTWFRAMIPATMLLVLLFFGMLHSWFNLWAEILRFGDREFYTDWWNVSNFGDYYRKWNIVVHEWLFHYVYQDILRFSKGKCSKMFSFVVVFMLSALIHELVLAVSIHFFYPILFILFGGPGVLCTFVGSKDSRIVNVIVWSCFFIGNGLLAVFYSWEHFARQTMDLSGKYGWKSFFIPHSWGIFK
ncbi:hypothetical protein SteCoe_36691 [Stentor coeruleus]|uniref:O-acyltransferase n=1 Tax=Stentor coeruleus TaxID=5963 RepID=A0A1R2APP1_9CILI|nr:hypothetical protein SteCoe_36691 [Stentor coeruleus]